MAAPPDRRLQRRAGVLVLSLLAAACTPAARSPDEWPERPWAANSGTFAVLQFATPDPDGVMAEWARAAPGAKLRTTHETRMDQPLTSFISFRNCKADPVGNCRVTAEWQLVDPGGAVRLTTRSAVRVGKPALTAGTVGLSTDGVTITFAAPDPPGAYRLRARTTDQVAGISLQTEDVITVRR